jgi:hypothetical protein
MRRARWIWILPLLWAFFILGTIAYAQQTESQPSSQPVLLSPSSPQPASSPAQDRSKTDGGTHLNQLLGENSLNLILTFVIGVAGSGAYYFAVYIGLIGRRSDGKRSEAAKYLVREDDSIYLIRLLLFLFFGGIVSLVFQLPQASAFAPIQAFVLGATWPSVVDRMIANDGRQKETPIIDAGGNMPPPTKGPKTPEEVEYPTR